MMLKKHGYLNSLAKNSLAWEIEEILEWHQLIEKPQIRVWHIKLRETKNITAWLILLTKEVEDLITIKQETV